jgi:hypothetical protein
MADFIVFLIYCGILCSPIIVFYGVVASLLICRRQRFASGLALLIAVASVVIICSFVTSTSEFDGEIAVGVSFMSFVIGMPIVSIAAMLTRKREHPRDEPSIDRNLADPVHHQYASVCWGRTIFRQRKTEPPNRKRRG